MAAKPPKPPGSFLKSLLNHNNNNINSKRNYQQHNNNEHNKREGNGEGLFTSTTTAATVATESSAAAVVVKTTTKSETTSHTDNSSTAPPVTATKAPSCCCSNISIMHLFHEMKQEFPTIPDTVVAQCVNENCHQRENCIQMLRNELELNPTPTQSYPAKVLHPPNTTIHSCSNNSNNNHISNNSAITTTSNTAFQKQPIPLKPVIVQQKPPLKPLKPIRAAPLHPPMQNNAKINSTQTSKKTAVATTGCETGGKENIGNNCSTGVSGRGDVELSGDMLVKTTSQYKQSKTTSTAVSSTTTTTSTTNNVNINNNSNVCASESIERNLPRPRPTTLNLNIQQQKQQRKYFNKQLLQEQEQRNVQQHQQQLQAEQQNHTVITKPIRRAPLPPVTPKPSQFLLNSTTANTNTISNNSLSSNHTSPLSESEISVSVSLSTPSPSSTPNTTHQHHTPTAHQTHQHLHTKSPNRHRSVITLQPEPPYTRNFLFSPSSPASSQSIQTANSASVTSSPTTSATGSQKSFTSVNLTLRPPVTPTDSNAALQPSTIDITAGPGFSGASSGGKSLHYSSTSYDARLGYQQNFQITVTDGVGLFSASRMRPQQQKQRSLNHQQHQQQQQLNLLQQQQQFHNNNVVALQQNIQNSIHSPQGIADNSSVGGGVSSVIDGNVCLPPQQIEDVFTVKTLQRQKERRDKLAATLRENKKRLSQVEQEINLLTGSIPSGLSERLDEEIQKLRTDCQAMCRNSNNFTQPSGQQVLSINYQPQQSQQEQQQQQQQQRQQSQSFPRQRITKPPPRPPPPPPRQTSLDFIQHHSQPSTPYAPPPAASLPNSGFYNTRQQQQTHLNFLTPTYDAQHPLFPHTNNDFYSDHDDIDDNNDIVDDDADDDDDDDYIEIEPWECNMCTFRNHPQLNICEACENVRILPGTLSNLSRAICATNCTNIASAVALPTANGLLSQVSAGSNNTIVTTNGNNFSNNSSSSNISSNSSSSSINRNGLNIANQNLEHDTNLAQQQMQHFALPT